MSTIPAINIGDHEIFKRISTLSGSFSSSSSIKHPKTVTRKGDEVFFAINSTIRVSKVGSSTSYKHLDLQNKINFTIEGIKLNSSGNLLTVYNEHNVVIVSLPTSSSIVNKEQSLIPTRSFTIASDIFSETEILEVLWNKASRYDSNLVILSSDGIIRSFDPRFSLEKPELTYDLTSSRLRNVGLNTDVSENPVSICFGATNTLSSMLTLYILDRDGDIFALYPFLPRELSASKDQVEELLNTSIVLAKDIESSGGEVLEKSNVVNQLKFVMSLWNQIDSSEREIRTTGINHIFKCDNISSTSLQGPFSISPYPDALYEKTTSSLTVVDCEYVDALAIGFEQGGYLLLVPNSELLMKWDDEYNYENEATTLAPGLSTVEYGSCKNNSDGSFVSFSSDKHSFVLQNGSQILKVDLSKLFTLYEQEFKSCLTEAELVDDISPKLINLYTLAPNEQLEAVSSFIDEYKTKTTFIVTNSKVKTLIPESKRDQPLLDSVDERIQKISTYQPQLGVPSFEIQKLIKKLKSTNINVSINDKSMLKPTESALTDLSKVSSEISSHLIDFHKFGIQINYKLGKQKVEFERQIQETNNLTEKLETLETVKSTNGKSIEIYVEKQKELDERLQKLNESLKKLTDTPLSTEEKKWFKEIADTARNFNKYAQQTEQWRKQLRYMKKVLEEKKKLSSHKNIITHDDVSATHFDLLNSQMLDAKKFLK